MCKKYHFDTQNLKKSPYRHRRTGPFPFGGGGHKMFCPNLSYLPEKSNKLHMGGGGGVRWAALLECQSWDTTEGEGVGGGYGGGFFGQFGY